VRERERERERMEFKRLKNGRVGGGRREQKWDGAVRLLYNGH